jgi:hypothetical protein
MSISQPQEETSNSNQPNKVGGKFAALKTIAKSFKRSVVAKSSKFNDAQEIVSKPVIDKTFLEKNIEPVLEKSIPEDNSSKTVDDIIESKKIGNDSDPTKKLEPKEKNYDSIINSGMSGLQADVQKVSGSVDSLVKINESILNTSEKIVKSLNDIKTILLQQVSLTKQQVEDQKISAEENSLEQSKISSGTQDYVKTYDDTPGNDDEGGGDGKGFLDKAFDAVDFADDIFDISKRIGGKRRKGIRGNRAYSKFRRTKPGRFLGNRFNLPRGIRSRKKLSAGGFLNTPYPAMSGGGMLSGNSGQPVMIGEAGPEIVTPTKLAGGGLKPGLYDNPTRGRLLPGQGVIPLNRNSGKKVFESKGGSKKEGAGFGMAQPLATAMTIPFKAIGGGLFGIAASFLPMMGPFGGLLRPFLSSIVRPLGKILGVPTQILDAALGAPQQSDFIFNKVFADLSKTFSIGGGDSESKVDDKGNVDNGRTSGEPEMTGPVPQGNDADFWSLAAISSREDVKPQGSADVAQSVYNRKASGAYGGNSIKDLINSSGQYEPTFGNKGAWRAIKDRSTAIKAAGSATNVDSSARAILNSQLQSKAKSFVQGRTDFLGESQKGNMRRDKGDITRGSGSNFFGWHNNYKQNKVGNMPSFNVKMPAESGANTMDDGNTESSYMIKGPNSGYPIKITTNNGETTDVLAHGKESVHVGQSGFTILPHENNKFSVSKNPFETFERWNTLATSTPSDKGKRHSAAAGISVNDRPWNSGIPLTDLTTKSGKTYQVATSLAPKFKGFVGDLEKTGYNIKSIGGWRKAGSGGGSGPPDPDYDKGRYHHPYGASVDINPVQNPYRPDGKLITDFPQNINDIAKKWGLGWGGNWRSSKDTMHFSAGKSEGGSGYDMTTGGELWRGNPVNPSDTGTSDTASADSSTQQQPEDPMEALKQSVSNAFVSLQKLQASFGGQKWEDVKGIGEGKTFDNIFKTAATTPVASSKDLTNAAAAGAALNASANTKPQVVAVNNSSPQTVSSVKSRETILQTRQKDLLARL